MRDNLDALLGETAKLVEVAEAVEKRVGPRIAAAGSVGGFCDPKRLSGLELVSELAIEGECFVSAAEPALAQCGLRCGLVILGGAPLRNRTINSEPTDPGPRICMSAAACFAKAWKILKSRP